MSIAADIRERIAGLEPGTAFVPSDFRDITGDVQLANNVLWRMERRGEIARALRGVYTKPEHIAELDEDVPPSPDSVARAIARDNGWAIVPSGNHALNLLGLDTQVPATYDYVSTGPYKTYRYGRSLIRMKHRASRDLVDRSYTTSLVIQALRALGKEHVDEDTVHRIASRLTQDERDRLYEETRNSTGWVFEFAGRVREKQHA